MKTIIDTLKSLVGGNSPRPESPLARRCIVDPGSGKSRDRLPPGVQVKMLQRLGRFAEKEALKVDVVFEGKDLRAVQHGGEFQGVNVFFVSNAADVKGAALKLVRDGGRGNPVMMVTDDTEIEKSVLGAGAQVMRLSTFEKALEGGLRRGGNNGSRGGSRSSGGSRNRRRRNEDQPRMSKQGGSDKDAVRDMLDLVE